MNLHEKTAVAPDELAALLWPEGDHPDGPQVYAIVDAARDPRIVAMIRATGLEQACLLSGALSPSLQAAAPYLVHLAPGVRFTRELFEAGWGESWFTLCVVPADVTLTQLRRHLRTLLRVRDEAGRKLMFRFYDPRVLGSYLPSCRADELNRVFGPIYALLVENEEACSLTQFTAAGGVLRRAVLATAATAASAEAM